MQYNTIKTNLEHQTTIDRPFTDEIYFENSDDFGDNSETDGGTNSHKITPKKRKTSQERNIPNTSDGELSDNVRAEPKSSALQSKLMMEDANKWISLSKTRLTTTTSTDNPSFNRMLQKIQQDNKDRALKATKSKSSTKK